MAPQGVAETAPVALLLGRALEEAGLGRRRWCGALRACGPRAWAPCGGRVCLVCSPGSGKRGRALLAVGRGRARLPVSAPGLDGLA